MGDPTPRGSTPSSRPRASGPPSPTRRHFGSSSPFPPVQSTIESVSSEPPPVPTHNFDQYSRPSSRASIASRPSSVIGGEGRSPIKRRPLPQSGHENISPERPASRLAEKRMTAPVGPFDLNKPPVPDFGAGRVTGERVTRSSVPARRTVPRGPDNPTPPVSKTSSQSRPSSPARPESVAGDMISRSPSRLSVSFTRTTSPNFRHSTILPSLDGPRFGSSAPHQLGRPASPLKGNNDFVQSAILRRNDSLNKRWSVHARPATDTGLERKGSITSVSSNSEIGPSRPSVVGPKSGSGPAIGTSSTPKLGHRASASMVDLGSILAPGGSASPIRSPLPTIPDTPPLEPNNNNLVASPPSPGKRWSPSKSSWLESALLAKPDRPTGTAPQKRRVDDQPAWMANLARAKASKQSVATPEPASASSSSAVAATAAAAATPTGAPNPTGSKASWHRDRLAKSSPSLPVGAKKVAEPPVFDFRSTLKKVDGPSRDSRPGPGLQTSPLLGQAAVARPESRLRSISRPRNLSPSGERNSIAEQLPAEFASVDAPSVAVAVTTPGLVLVSPDESRPSAVAKEADNMLSKSSTPSADLRTQLAPAPVPPKGPAATGPPRVDFRANLRSAGASKGGGADIESRPGSSRRPAPLSEFQSIVSKFQKAESRRLSPILPPNPEKPLPSPTFPQVKGSPVTRTYETNLPRSPGPDSRFVPSRSPSVASVSPATSPSLLAAPASFHLVQEATTGPEGPSALGLETTSRTVSDLPSSSLSGPDLVLTAPTPDHGHSGFFIEAESAPKAASTSDQNPRLSATEMGKRVDRVGAETDRGHPFPKLSDRINPSLASVMNSGGRPSHTKSSAADDGSSGSGASRSELSKPQGIPLSKTGLPNCNISSKTGGSGPSRADKSESKAVPGRHIGIKMGKSDGLASSVSHSQSGSQHRRDRASSDKSTSSSSSSQSRSSSQRREGLHRLQKEGEKSHRHAGALGSKGRGHGVSRGEDDAPSRSIVSDYTETTSRAGKRSSHLFKLGLHLDKEGGGSKAAKHEVACSAAGGDADLPAFASTESYNADPKGTGTGDDESPIAKKDTAATSGSDVSPVASIHDVQADEPSAAEEKLDEVKLDVSQPAEPVEFQLNSHIDTGGLSHPFSLPSDQTDEGTIGSVLAGIAEEKEDSDSTKFALPEESEADLMSDEKAGDQRDSLGSSTRSGGDRESAKDAGLADDSLTYLPALSYSANSEFAAEKLAAAAVAATAEHEIKAEAQPTVPTSSHSGQATDLPLDLGGVDSDMDFDSLEDALTKELDAVDIDSKRPETDLLHREVEQPIANPEESHFDALASSPDGSLYNESVVEYATLPPPLELATESANKSCSEPVTDSAVESVSISVSGLGPDAEPSTAEHIEAIEASLPALSAAEADELLAMMGSDSEPEAGTAHVDTVDAAADVSEAENSVGPTGPVLIRVESGHADKASHVHTGADATLPGPPPTSISFLRLADRERLGLDDDEDNKSVSVYSASKSPEMPAVAVQPSIVVESPPEDGFAPSRVSGLNRSIVAVAEEEAAAYASLSDDHHLPDSHGGDVAGFDSRAIGHDDTLAYHDDASILLDNGIAEAETVDRLPDYANMSLPGQTAPTVPTLAVQKDTISIHGDVDLVSSVEATPVIEIAQAIDVTRAEPHPVSVVDTPVDASPLGISDLETRPVSTTSTDPELASISRRSAESAFDGNKQENDDDKDEPVDPIKAGRNSAAFIDSLPAYAVPAIVEGAPISDIGPSGATKDGSDAQQGLSESMDETDPAVDEVWKDAESPDMPPMTRPEASSPEPDRPVPSSVDILTGPVLMPPKLVIEDLSGGSDVSPLDLSDHVLTPVIEEPPQEPGTPKMRAASTLEAESPQKLSQSSHSNRVSMFGLDAAGLFSIFFGFVPPLQVDENLPDVMSILEAGPYDEAKIKTDRENKKTVKCDVFRIQADGSADKIDPAEVAFYASDCYAVVHSYTPPTAPATSPGGLFGAMAAWRARKPSSVAELFVWIGSDVDDDRVAAAVTAAKTVGRSSGASGREDVQVNRQNKESIEFLSLLPIPFTTFLAAHPGPDSPTGPFPAGNFMLCVRRHLGRVVIDQTDRFLLRRLSSGFPFIIVTGAGSADCRVVIWKGRGCFEVELAAAREQVNVIAKAVSAGTVSIVEIDDGHEDDDFIKMFPDARRDHLPPVSESWTRRPKHNVFHPRCFRFSAKAGSDGSGVTVDELAPFSAADLRGDAVFMIDGWSEIFILPSPAARAHPGVFTSALSFAQDYSILAPTQDSRPFVPVSNIVMEGFPRDIKAVFRGWVDGVAWTRDGDGRKLTEDEMRRRSQPVSDDDDEDSPTDRQTSPFGQIVGLTAAIAALRPK